MVIDGHVDVLGVDRNDILHRLMAPRSGVPVHVAFDGSDLIVSVDAVSGASAQTTIQVGLDEMVDTISDTIDLEQIDTGDHVPERAHTLGKKTAGATEIEHA